MIFDFYIPFYVGSLSESGSGTKIGMCSVPVPLTALRQNVAVSVVPGSTTLFSSPAYWRVLLISCRNKSLRKGVANILNLFYVHNYRMTISSPACEELFWPDKKVTSCFHITPVFIVWVLVKFMRFENNAT